MTNPIVRMYETERRARDAVAKLRAEGYPKDWIFLMTPPPAAPAAAVEPLPETPAAITETAPELATEEAMETAPAAVARPLEPAPRVAAQAIEPAGEREAVTVEGLSMAVLAGFIPKGEAEAYADGLRLGRSLVAVRAPFGQAREAIIILDSFDPVAVAAVRRAPQQRSPAWDEAAPLSSALQWRTIQSNRPAPFSAVLGLPTLSRGRSFLSPMFGELGSPHFALFGRSSLSAKAAPLSALFGLKTLSSGKAGAAWTSSFGLRLLSANPAPLSSKLGLEVSTGGPLRSQAAPLSAVLGIPALSPGRTWLSRLFGELGSSHFALFGRNPLISNPAPLSSRLGLKTLSGKSGADWTSSLGLPLLARSAPTSLGLPLLSRNPAPLSWLFGLPVLSRYQ